MARSQQQPTHDSSDVQNLRFFTTVDAGFNQTGAAAIFRYKNRDKPKSRQKNFDLNLFSK